MKKMLITLVLLAGNAEAVDYMPEIYDHVVIPCLRTDNPSAGRNFAKHVVSTSPDLQLKIEHVAAAVYGQPKEWRMQVYKGLLESCVRGEF